MAKPAKKSADGKNVSTAKPPAKHGTPPIAQNRRARFDYEIGEQLEAGLVLYGTEVKSLRAGRCQINEAHAAEMKGELWLFNAYIAEYEGGNRFNHETRRPRKLLLHAREMKKLMGQVKMKGMTLVPLRFYFNAKGFAKVMLGLGRGKKEYEKRDTEKKREWDREKSRIMKNRE